MSNEFRKLHLESAKVTFAHEKHRTIAYANKGNESVVIGEIVNTEEGFSASLGDAIPSLDLGNHTSEERAKRAIETGLNEFIVRNDLNPWPSKD